MLNNQKAWQKINDYSNRTGGVFYRANFKTKTQQIMITKTEKQAVAQTIVNQLGGIGKLKAFTGAYSFATTKGNTGVTFRIKNRKVNAITIVLNGKDLYDIKFMRVRGVNIKLIKEYNDIYFNQLIPLFEENTGIYLTL